MITGPAMASGLSGVQISNMGGVVANVQGPLTWNFGPAWESSGYGTTVSLGLSASCGTAGPCSAIVDFWFNVYSPTLIGISLNGWSTDPGAGGMVEFNNGISGWGVGSEGQLFLQFSPFDAVVDGSDQAYQGSFTILRLAPGQTVNVSPETSLDFTTNFEPPSSAPEPGSVLLLGGGIAFVVFLRRKIRA
jgi:hypothetical protein